jgi:hypothetical protein
MWLVLLALFVCVSQRSVAESVALVADPSTLPQAVIRASGATGRRVTLSFPNARLSSSVLAMSPDERLAVVREVTHIVVTSVDPRSGVSLRNQWSAIVAWSSFVSNVSESAIVIEFGHSPKYYSTVDEAVAITFNASIFESSNESVTPATVTIVADALSGTQHAVLTAAQITTAVVVLLGSTTGIPAATGLHFAQAAFSAGLADCAFVVSAEPSRFDAPLLTELGSSEFRFQVGGMVLNAVLLTALITLHLIGVVVLFLTRKKAHPPHPAAFLRTGAAVLFPSAQFIFACYLLRPTISFSLRVLVNGSGAGSSRAETIAWQTAAGIILGLSLCGATFLAFQVLSGFRSEFQHGVATPNGWREPTRFDNLFVGRGQWTDAPDAPTPFTLMYASLFAHYRPRAQWFLVIELIVAIGLGTVGAWMPVDGQCWSLAAMTGLLMFLLAVVALIAQPFQASAEWITFQLHTLLIVGASLAVAMQPLTRAADWGEVKSISFWFSVAAMAVVALKGFAEVIAHACGLRGVSEGKRPMPSVQAPEMGDYSLLLPNDTEQQQRGRQRPWKSGSGQRRTALAPVPGEAQPVDLRDPLKTVFSESELDWLVNRLDAEEEKAALMREIDALRMLRAREETLALRAEIARLRRQTGLVDRPPNALETTRQRNPLVPTTALRSPRGINATATYGNPPPLAAHRHQPAPPPVVHDVSEYRRGVAGPLQPPPTPRSPRAPRPAPLSPPPPPPPAQPFSSRPSRSRRAMDRSSSRRSRYRLSRTDFSDSNDDE